MASTCIKQEEGSDDSVLHINVKKEKEDLHEISPTPDYSPQVTDASESWWRDYMLVSEEKPAITENLSALVQSNQSQVSVLRSFKRHRHACNNSSASAKDASVSSAALASLVRRNFASPPLQPLEITTSPQNVNNNVNNNKNKARKSNDKCANKNNDINSKNYSVHNLSNVIMTTTTTTDKAMKDERENLFVTEGLLKREEEDSDYCEEVTIVPSDNDTKASSIARTPTITVVDLSPSRGSVRSLLRGVRIRPVQETSPVVADALAMEFQNDPTEETVKKELSEIAVMDVDEPKWVGKSSSASRLMNTSPDDNDDSDLEEDDDEEEEDDDDDDEEEEDDADEGDEVKENEDDGHSLAVRQRTCKKFEVLTMKIRRSQLKSSSSEMPLKMRFTGNVVSGTGEYEMYRYQCPFCPFYTNYVVQMKRHRIRHIPDGALNCKRCDYTTKSRQEYKMHLIKHYQAAAGGGDSDDTDEEENELGSADSPEGYNTEPTVDKDLVLCNKPMPSVLPLIPGGPPNIVDAIIATPETKLFEKILDLRCKYCPFFTTYKSIMNQHRTIHQAEGVMYCPQCDLSTWEKEEYKNHLLKHYQRDSFTCEYCGYSTISQYLYMNHRVKHTEKTYCCDDCPYTTGFKKAFKYHRLKHSAEKLLRCKHCSFITKYRHNYRQHMATHTGKGLMFCDFCSFYSAWETNFRRHLARHTIEEEARRLEEQARREAELRYATKTK